MYHRTLHTERRIPNQTMLKKLMNKIFGGSLAGASTDGFFLDVRCSQCGDEFHLFVNRTTDLAQEFGENGKLTYFLNKEIIGANCRNLIHVRMRFDETKNLISKNIENGEFID